MKVMAFNGSPRKEWNTATLLKSALEGAKSAGAQTELIHLYDLSYKGCISCFSCKLVGGKSYGKCALQDDLTPVLERVEEADGLLLGSPIYLGGETGAMHSFMERMMFHCSVYDYEKFSLLKKTIPSVLIYTMNLDEDTMRKEGYEYIFRSKEFFMSRVFGPTQTLCVTDTMQFSDHSKYIYRMFDPEKKIRRRKEIFPQDCQKAFELGKKLVQKN